MLGPPDKNNAVSGRCALALRATSAIDEPELLIAVRDVLGRRRDSIEEDQLCRAAGTLGWLDATWDSLGTENVTRLKQLLIWHNIDKLVGSGTFLSGIPDHVELKEPYMQALARLDNEQLFRLVGWSSHEKSQFVPIRLSAFKAAGSFREAESIAVAVLQLTGCLKTDDLRTLSQAFVENNQIHLASAMPTHMSSLVRATLEVDGARSIWTDMYQQFHATKYKGLNDSGRHYAYGRVADLLGLERAAVATTNEPPEPDIDEPPF